MPTYTILGASATPMFPDKPNLIRSAILRATINNWPKTETVIDSIINGYSVNYRGAQNYGYSGDYYRGAWYSNSIEESIEESVIKEWMANELNVPTSAIVFTEFSYNPLFIEEYDLGLTHNIFNGKVDASSGYYLDSFGTPTNLVSEVTDLSYSRISPDGEPLEYDLVVTYDTFDPSNKANTLTKDLTWTRKSVLVGEVSLAPVCIKVEFTYNSISNFYFTYDPLSFIYPTLSDQVLTEDNDRYFPIAMLRNNNEWVGEMGGKSLEQNNLERAQTKKLLNFYGINLDSTIEEVNTNPDIDEIDRAYIAPALVISDLLEIDEASAEYLFLFINDINDNYEPRDFNETTYSLFNDKAYRLDFYERKISDFKVILAWDSVDVYPIPFVTGKPRYEFSAEINYAQGYNEIWEESMGPASTIYVDHYDKDTGNAYRAKLVGLVSVINSTVRNRNSTPIFTLRNAFPLSSEDTLSGIILPINFKYIRRMNKAKATSIMTSSLVLVTQSIDQVKLKWYEDPGFWKAINAIIFLISVAYMSPQLSAAANQGVRELVIYILESVIIGQLVTEAVGFVLSILADAIGGEAAVIVAAIAAAAAAIYGGTQSFNLNLPFADEVLKLSNVIMTQIQALQQKRVKQFQEDVAEFKEDYNALLNEIEEAADLLPDLLMNPYWLLDNSVSILNESSNDFIARNTNLNPNELCFSAITNFTDNALRLPTLADVNNNF